MANPNAFRQQSAHSYKVKDFDGGYIKKKREIDASLLDVRVPVYWK